MGKLHTCIIKHIDYYSKNCNNQADNEVFIELKNEIDELKPEIKKIVTLRNKFYAHLELHRQLQGDTTLLRKDVKNLLDIAYTFVLKVNKIEFDVDYDISKIS